MSIILGGYDFDGPYPIDRWVAPHEEGVYAVLRKTGSADGAAAYAPIYVGETDDFAAHGLPVCHPRFACWTKETGGTANAYIGAIYTPGDGRFLRRLVWEGLLGEFHPICNYDWPHRWAGAMEDAASLR